MVYSTCSLNPVEDELVVLDLLVCSGPHQMRLLDVNALLKGAGVALNSRGGLLPPDEYGATGKPLPGYGSRTPMTRVEFDALRAEVAQRVLRVLPHRDDTGGFFVAVFEKPATAPLQTLPQRPQSNRWGRAKLFAPVRATDVEWRQIVDYFGLGAAAKTLQSDDVSALLSAAGTMSSSSPVGTSGVCGVWGNGPDGQPRRLHLTSPLLMTVVTNATIVSGAPPDLGGVGLRAFAKLDNGYLASCPCRWRPATEAAPLVGPLCTRRVLRLTSTAPNTPTTAAAATEDLRALQVALLRTGSCVAATTTDAATSGAASSALLHRLLVHAGDLVASAEGSRSTVVDGVAAAFEAGPLFIEFELPFAAGGKSWWVAGQLTAGGKVELLVEHSTRRVVLLSAFGVLIPHYAAGGANKRAAPRRRVRENEEPETALQVAADNEADAAGSGSGSDVDTAEGE
jgi:hypothetical protein